MCSWGSWDLKSLRIETLFQPSITMMRRFWVVNRVNVCLARQIIWSKIKFNEERRWKSNMMKIKWTMMSVLRPFKLTKITILVFDSGRNSRTVYSFQFIKSLSARGHTYGHFYLISFSFLFSFFFLLITFPAQIKCSVGNVNSIKHSRNPDWQRLYGRCHKNNMPIFVKITVSRMSFLSIG